MKMTVVIESVNFTSFIRAGEFTWEKNDIDGSDAGRTLDGVMHRHRVASKRKLSFSCKRMTTEQFQSLCAALSPEYVQVTYLDPELGMVTKTFYSSQVSSVTWGVINGTTYWDKAQFSLVER